MHGNNKILLLVISAVKGIMSTVQKKKTKETWQQGDWKNGTDYLRHHMLQKKNDHIENKTGIFLVVIM